VTTLPRGVLVPLVTPFKADESLDLRAYEEQIEWMIGANVHGLVIGGSSGEGYALEAAELAALVDCALEVASGRIPVIVGVIADSTRQAIARIRATNRSNVVAFQVTPPHYIFRSSHDELVAFYREVAAAAERPIIIYNVIPWANIDPQLAARIATEVPGVSGFKQSNVDITQLLELRSIAPQLDVFAAIDPALRICYEAGAVGSIAAIATAAPHASVKLWNAVMSGDRATAAATEAGLTSLWHTLRGPNLPARLKAAQTLQGLSSGLARSPMAMPGDAERRRIEDALQLLR
jgi:dihydrodipicolinate synthase/N-acetylneuraminate lyase